MCVCEIGHVQDGPKALQVHVACGATAVRPTLLQTSVVAHPLSEKAFANIAFW